MSEGTKNLEEALGFVLSFVQAVSLSLKDGKVDYLDALNFIDVISKIGPAVEEYKQIPKEIKDLTSEEVDQISEKLKTEFDIENDILEENIELALEVTLKLAQLIGKIS